MSTKPMSEFDEKAAHVAALNEGYDSNAYREHRAFEEGAKWQFTQLQSELEKKDAEIEELKKRLSAFDHNHFTRDIKERGECPACDRYHMKAELEAERAKVAKLKEALTKIAFPFATRPDNKFELQDRIQIASKALKESGDE